MSRKLMITRAPSPKERKGWLHNGDVLMVRERVFLVVSAPNDNGEIGGNPNHCLLISLHTGNKVYFPNGLHRKLDVGKIIEQMNLVIRVNAERKRNNNPRLVEPGEVEHIKHNAYDLEVRLI